MKYHNWTDNLNITGRQSGAGPGRDYLGLTAEEKQRRERIRRTVDLIHDAKQLGQEHLCEVWEQESA